MLSGNWFKQRHSSPGATGGILGHLCFSLAMAATGALSAIQCQVLTAILNSMLFILDNYDSFTYNLVQRFGEIDSRLDVHVARNDQIAIDEIAAMKPSGIVVSPGPCTPHEAGISMELIRQLGPKIPTLGVCLGHQSLAEVFDSQVIRAERLMHGKTSLIHHLGTGVFAGLPNPFTATRYHSLVVPEATLSPDLEVTAWADFPGHPREIMGLRHRRHPIHGVQFHPESFLTEGGIEILKNFLKIAGEIPRPLEPTLVK